MKRHRLAIVASHVIQYQDPFFRQLAKDPAVDVMVLYCSRAGADVYRDADMQTSLRWDIELLQGYRHEFLRNLGRGDGTLRLINPGIVPAILRGRYDAVIFFLGWGTVTSLAGIAACRMSDTPYLLFGDSSFIPPRRVARDALLRAIVGLAGGFLVSGAFNAHYYQHYGADPARFFEVPWAIDNDRFATASRFAPGEREALRARAGIGAKHMAIVFSAKLLSRKDPMTLLRAVDSMRLRDRAALIFLGHGELREQAETFARERGLTVHFAGFVNQTDLPKHYAMADVFVLPSLDDPRATVVNEAMACGLPVIITDRCGPAGDIVRHGENGFVFEPGDFRMLASHLDTLAGDSALRARMGERSRAIIASWDYAHGVEGVMKALHSLEHGL